MFLWIRIHRLPGLRALVKKQEIYLQKWEYTPLVIYSFIFPAHILNILRWNRSMRSLHWRRRCMRSWHRYALHRLSGTRDVCSWLFLRSAQRGIRCNSSGIVCPISKIHWNWINIVFFTEKLWSKMENMWWSSLLFMSRKLTDRWRMCFFRCILWQPVYRIIWSQRQSGRH